MSLRRKLEVASRSVKLEYAHTARRHSSRHQARQHLHHGCWHGQNRRLWSRPAGELGADPQQRDDGHDQLHVARADPRRARGPSRGHLLNRRGLYELLSRRRAFEGESVRVTLYKILELSPQPLWEIDRTFPDGGHSIVDRALAKPRDERYQQVGDMLRDLTMSRQQITAMDSPAVARRASRMYGLASEMPTIRTPTIPIPAWIRQLNPSPSVAAGPRRRRRRRRRRTDRCAGPAISDDSDSVATAALALASQLSRSDGDPPPGTSAPIIAPPVSVKNDPPIGELMQKAMTAFEAEDYAGADPEAQAVLVRHPGACGSADTFATGRTSPPQLVERRPQESADNLFDQGKFEEASRAAGEMLSVAPGQCRCEADHVGWRYTLAGTRR